jgi:cell division protein ZapE
MKQPKTPSELYAARVASGAVVADHRQQPALAAFDALYAALAKKRILKKNPAKSLYVWGEVGRGKSMLMDLFFEAAPTERKQRVHFHAFMQHVHARLHALRMAKQGDPVALLVKETAEAVRLLCFDEFQATDVADASLLFRLFEGLFAVGVVVVATSNRPPENVYTGGVQRERFDKFVALLNAEMSVISLTGEVDYRRTKTAHTQAYFYPLGEAADRFIDEALPNVAPVEKTLHVQGRALRLTAYGDVLKVSFAELCEVPLGVADYLAIAEAFPTVILTNVPKLSPEKRNEAKRFVSLIDVLYERKTKLVMTAETPIDAIYPEGDGSFEFHRTASRLMEMQGW